MATLPMTPDLMVCIADRFKILAEPARLQILHSLRGAERNVSDLVEQTGLGQANVSKHLQLLLANGFVTRRKEGLYAWYRLADQGVFNLCDIMCGRLEREAALRQQLLAP